MMQAALTSNPGDGRSAGRQAYRLLLGICLSKADERGGDTRDLLWLCFWWATAVGGFLDQGQMAPSF